MSRDEDVRAIERSLVDYATAIDTHDYALLDRIFLPEAALDYTSVKGAVGSYREIRPWLEKRMARFEVLQHLVGNFAITVDGDAATSRSYVRAMHGHRVEGTLVFFEIGGVYEDTWIRTPQGFRLASRTLHHLFTQGTLPMRQTRS